MSKLSESIASVKAEASAAGQRVDAKLAGLAAQVSALQTAVADGTATDADFADLASIKASIAGIAPSDAPPAP